MARALGRGPEDEAAGGTHQLTRHVRGTVGLLLTNRAPEAIHAYFGAELATQHKVDFARAGTLASRDFSVPSARSTARAAKSPPNTTSRSAIPWSLSSGAWDCLCAWSAVALCWRPRLRLWRGVRSGRMAFMFVARAMCWMRARLAC